MISIFILGATMSHSQETELLSAVQWVEQTLSSLTLEEKIAQLLIVDFPAVYSHRESENFRRIERLIREAQVGGIVLAGGTVRDIAAMTNALQKISKLPLLVNADLESGLGFSHSWHWMMGRGLDLPRYVPGGGTVFPVNMAIGATGKEDYAYRVGKITAEEARAVGIHWTNSPVVDVNNNPANPIINTRSFGEDPEWVARLGAAYVRGCQEGGALATLKHFPGHGDTHQDSHMGLPVLDFEMDRLSAVELVPFKRGIEAGAMAVMTAHIALPQVDSTRRPATLSPQILTGLLREQLGFTGLIVTDGLTMQGITDHYGPEETVLLALEAGNDALLNPPNAQRALRYLVKAVRTGRLPEERINQSVRRLLAAKARVGLHKNRFVDLEAVDRVVGAPSSWRLSEQIAQDAITLVEYRDGTLPLKTHRLVVAVVSDALRGDYGRFLVRRLRKRGKRVEMFRLTEGSSGAQWESVVRASQQSGAVIVAAYVYVGAWKGRIGLAPSVVEQVQRLIAVGKPLIFVSFGDPYLLAQVRGAAASLCAYCGLPQMEEAVAKALTGEANIQGKLPVTIPGLAQRGQGIEFKTRR